MDSVVSPNTGSQGTELGAELDKPLGLAVAHASGLVGLDSFGIRVEVCSTRGPAFFQMVGLPEAAVREARVRVQSALGGLGILLDEYAITVNLAPADVRKSGAALDLAIAVAILGALEVVPASALDGILLLGELSLDGGLRGCRGVLPQLFGAQERGFTAAIVADDNRAEAAAARGLQVAAARTLKEVALHLAGTATLPALEPLEFAAAPQDGPLVDFSDIAGQALGKRAVEAAAAGGHHLLMSGPPGVGKTLLAQALAGLLPPLELSAALETTAIHSVVGAVEASAGLVRRPPFRAPHHSVSEAGLVGGGNPPRPGELSLAHSGVLFLDELPEFRRSALEALRQPLEGGQVVVSRARYQATFPARPIVVAAMNPCPCGFLGHPTRRCRCSVAEARRYRRRLSGPFLDRIDLHVVLAPIDLSALKARRHGESTSTVRQRVVRARALQRERAQAQGLPPKLNAHLSTSELGRVVRLTPAALRRAQAAGHALGLSARAYNKVLGVARTFADLEGAHDVSPEFLMEAIQGRVVEAP